MKTERPILFSAPMVRAILDGHKTQTRRILKGSTEFKGPYSRAYLNQHRNAPGWANICPHGKVGDTLWVRETGVKFPLAAPTNRQKPFIFAHDVPVHQEYGRFIVQETEAPGASCNVGCWGHKRNMAVKGAKSVPSIHMPRWACRLRLQITGIRVEPLHAIDDDGALAEGAPLLSYRGGRIFVFR